MPSPTDKQQVILSIGACVLDRLLALKSYPSPDEKVRTTAYHEIGGGNAANTATTVARLSQAAIFAPSNFCVKLLAKVGDDNVGQQVVAELQRDGVDLSSPLFRVVPGATTGLTTILVSDMESTRTCLHTPGTCGELTIQELEALCMEDIFANVVHLHADGRHPEVALALAKEARRKGISVSIDVEKDRESKPLDDLLEYATVVFTNAGQVEAYLNRLEQERETVQGKGRLTDLQLVVVTLGDQINEKHIDLMTHLMRPSMFFTRWNKQRGKEVVITRGEEGAVHIKCQSVMMSPDTSRSPRPANEMEIDIRGGTITLNSASLKHVFIDGSILYSADYVMTTVGVLSNARIVDTTGAGDTFIGAFLLSRGAKHDLQTCLRFSSWASGSKLGGPGARTAIPKASAVDVVLGRDYGSFENSLKELVGCFRSPKYTRADKESLSISSFTNEA